MTGVDMLDFRALMADLAAAYRKTLDQHGFESYFDGLEDLSIRQIRDGVRHAKRESQYMPSVAKIRESVRHAQQAKAGHSIGRPQLEPTESWCPACEDTGWCYVDERRVDATTMPEWAVKNISRQRLLDDVKDPANVPLYRGERTHTKAVKCPCRTENPMYQWKREQERRKVSHDATQRG